MRGGRLLSILLILAWKNAGYLGLDRFLLPLLGTPWKQRAAATRSATRTTSVSA